MKSLLKKMCRPAIAVGCMAAIVMAAGVPAAMGNTTVQILHASDLEGGVDAIGNAPIFAAIMDHLEDEYPNTIILSAGDNYIPGPFFQLLRTTPCVISCKAFWSNRMQGKGQAASISPS